jgi:hypothetical protein
MKTNAKFALAFAILHSLAPLWVFVRISRTSDGTEQWANTLPLYWLDFPLYPVFVWIQDNPHLRNSSFINAGVSLLLGGLLYAGIGWWIGCRVEHRRKRLRTGVES